ncbi:MAG: DUF58 domain-containing protein [Anaerolineales bacterium]|nr:DUF58 domain-containing protein [Anaerolineales bacterium]
MNARQPWVRLILFFLIIGFLLERGGLLTLAGMMVVVIGVSWLWSRYSLDRISYSRRLPLSRGFPGENIDCQVVVENNKILPLGWLELRDRWPWSAAPEDENMLAGSQASEEGILRILYTMRGFHRIKREIKLRLRKRGVFTLGPLETVSGDPFGFFESRKKVDNRQKIVVYPEMLSVEQMKLNPDDPFGLSQTRRRLYQDSTRPIGIRDYRPEDGFRQIHWPATARMGVLQTRVFQPISGLDLVICMNVATFEPYWQGVQPELLEALLSTSASLAYQSFLMGYRVGLISNGGMAHARKTFRVPPGRSPKHMPHLLESLAAIKPVAYGPFDRFLLREAPYLEYGSTLIVVTGVMPKSLHEALFKLKARSRKVVLVALTEEEPEFIHNTDIIHLPFEHSEKVQ